MIPSSVIAPHILHELAETARAVPPGDFVEVGVYRGGSAAYLAQVVREQPARRLFLFDTFTGIPHSVPGIDAHKVGDFGDTSLAAVRAAVPEAVCVPGIFPDTLDEVDVGPIAFAHVDCDQYVSVKACCETLAPRMVPGGVMWFDDYDCLPGARQAVDESFGCRVYIGRAGKAQVVF